MTWSGLSLPHAGWNGSINKWRSRAGGASASGFRESHVGVAEYDVFEDLDACFSCCSCADEELLMQFYSLKMVSHSGIEGRLKAKCSIIKCAGFMGGYSDDTVLLIWASEPCHWTLDNCVLCCEYRMAIQIRDLLYQFLNASKYDHI